MEHKTLKPLGEFLVVVDGGFDYHGDVTGDGDFYLVSHAKNIRVWGTTKGFGELRTGPTPKTVLDETGEILIPKHRLCHLIRANWKR